MADGFTYVFAFEQAIQICRDYNEIFLRVKYKHDLIGCPAESNRWRLKRHLVNDVISEKWED